MVHNQPKIDTDRVIRVFISSTFRDMMKERDLLVKQVFPALRRICAKRFVTFTEVDLRWGITEEQAAEGKVLPLCLAEIERSRPYFVGLLGERYGWIPDAIPDEVIEKEPWLKEHLFGRKSVTELEILHGVFNDPEMLGHSFFYFRDPAYVSDPALSKEDQQEMVERDIPAEIEKFGPEEASRRTEERKGKLAALKQQIRDSGLPLVEPYERPEALAKIIESQFEELIDVLYPETEVPDPLIRERLNHEVHAKNKLFACIDRPAHLAVLNSFASLPEHDGKGLVITGESGSGKTALLSAWARDWAQLHPEDFLFQHYFGATPDSSSPDGFLIRLLGELKNRFDITEDVPSQPDKLREALPLWLAQTVNKGRIILIFDGLNQVQEEDSDKSLNFLPGQFPPHVVVLASALPGPALDALRKRHWAEHDLPLADKGEVTTMVDVYLGIHARSLEPSLLQQLITAAGSKNPLFLRTVLEELRQFGSFEQLPSHVQHYLEADNPKELFLRVIRRWQSDFDGQQPVHDKERIDLVRRGLTHLWAAREGLSEPEWLDLLGKDGEPLPRGHWTPFFLALEPHLSQRTGLFAFDHDYIRQAVETEFLAAAHDRRAAHLALADFFGVQDEMTPRKAAEWPWQLHVAEEWGRLEACLTDIPLFLALYNDKTKWELAGYWHPLRKIGIDMATCYTSAFDRQIRNLKTLDYYVYAQLGRFFTDNGMYPAAETLLKQALTASEQILGPEHSNTLLSVNNLAGLLDLAGDYSGAQSLYERAIDASDRIFGPEHFDTLRNLHNLAVVLIHKEDYERAQLLIVRTLEVYKQLLGPEHPKTLTSLNNLAGLMSKKGDYVNAQPMFEQVIDASERILGLDHPHTMKSVNNLAGLLASKGDFTKAQLLYVRLLEARERVLGPEHTDTLTSLSDLALLLTEKGDYVAAAPMFEKVISASERVLGTEHPNTLTSIHNYVDLLYRKGDYVRALPLCERVFEARERILGPEHSNTLLSMNNLAYLLEKKGDLAGAQTLYERAIDANGRIFGPEHPDTLTSLNNLVRLLIQKKDFAGAQQLYIREVNAKERLLGPEHPDTLTSVSKMALLLSIDCDYMGAKPLFERVVVGLSRSSQASGRVHPDLEQIVNNYGVCLNKMGYNQEQIQAIFRKLAVDVGLKLSD